MITSAHASLIIYTSKGKEEFYLEGYHDVKIGRSNDNDIIILDQWVSRHHAIIKRVDSQQYCLIDLGTRNGSFLNEELVSLPTILNHGDIIRLGQTKLKFHGVMSTLNEDNDTSTGTYIELEENSLDEEVETSLMGLISVVGIHLYNLKDLDAFLSPQIKKQILEDFYKELQRCIQKLTGYVYIYNNEYLIALWQHNYPEDKALEGIKMINLLLHCHKIINNIKTKYAIPLPLILRFLTHTDLTKVKKDSFFVTVTIEDLLKEKYIKRALFLLNKIEFLNGEIVWDHNSYDHLSYFPVLKQQLHCYFINEENPSKEDNQIYGIKSDIFENISFINPVINFIKSLDSEILATFLNTQIGLPLNYNSFNLQSNSEDYQKLIICTKKLEIFQVKLDSEIKERLEFILGIVAGGNNKSCEHFEISLSFAHHHNNLIRKACINYCLGFYWYSIAWQNLWQDKNSLIKAKFYFEQCIYNFEQAERGDRIAKMINFLMEILIELEEWESLEKLIKKGMTLHKKYSSVIYNANDLAYLTQMYLTQGQYEKAEKLMKKAFSMLIEQEKLLEKSFLEYQGWYLFLISQIQQKTGRIKEGIKNLNRAKIFLESSDNIWQKIKLLNNLYSYYTEENDLDKAFTIEIEKQSLEQQYQKHYFGEFGYLKQRKLLKGKISISHDYYNSVLREKRKENILLSGRKNPSHELIDKINIPTNKLLVIYGENSQGKSSFLQMGILPFFEGSAGNSQWDCFLVNEYHKWIENMGEFLFNMWKKTQPYNSVKSFLINKLEDLNKLAQELDNSLELSHNILIVFDQLERFFYLYLHDENKQNDFVDFISHLLRLNHFKLIFSLEKSYLAYLIQFNDRNNRGHITQINRNIFELKDFYYLDKLNCKDIKESWAILTQNFDFPFTPELTNLILQALTQENNGEINLKELHIVMAQLEKKRIFTLEDYKQNFSSDQEFRLDEILQEFLNYILNYCGENNRQLAQLILYYLTEKQRKKLVVKTFRELIKDLKLIDYSFDMKQVKLILDIFVESNLIIRIFAPTDIHYKLSSLILIPYICENYSGETPE
jgi:hypothetical protein